MKTSDQQCITFLQWALPRLKMRWPGFRKVRKQVCKRIKRRLKELDLENFDDYRNYLQKTDAEWLALDKMCRIHISRFYRDRALWDYLKEKLLPELAKGCISDKKTLQILSAGCASGEEPYTLTILLEQAVKKEFPELDYKIVACDLDENILERAAKACYKKGSLKELPASWLSQAFDQNGEDYCLKANFKEKIQFLRQDIRNEMPQGPFDVIFCRNLVATYFDFPLQVEIFSRMRDELRQGGYFILGSHEVLPAEVERLRLLNSGLNIYQK